MTGPIEIAPNSYFRFRSNIDDFIDLFITACFL